MGKTAYIILFCFMGAFQIIGYSQNDYTQKVRGKVTDSQTDETLPGATITILGTVPLIGATADVNGNFLLKNIPVGRYTIQVSYVGYKTAIFRNLLLTAGKELVLDIALEERIVSLDDVVIVAPQNKIQHLHPFATTSVRSFTVEETERYAGSLGDPSRMVSNYAGVMSVSDERNDIIIRGNSPTGLLWRLEGIDIPSPNHFSTNGATGGPVSMINNNLLANSDFFTGAFPAEYGNALAGAFDLQLRNGNNQKYEFLGQIGFGGFELGAEGPFTKKSPSSFLINYRYSTLAVFDFIGIPLDFGTGGAIPYYQDLAFKVNLPSKRSGLFEIFGVGGKSNISMLDKDRDTTLNTQIENTDLYNGSTSGILGVKHTYYFQDKSKIITKLSSTYLNYYTDIDSLQRNQVDEKWRYYTSKSQQTNQTLDFSYFKKINKKNTVNVGTKISLLHHQFIDSVYDESEYVTHFDEKGNYTYSQSFATWQYRFSDQFTVNSGLHAFYFFLNQQFSLEPRFNVIWKLNNTQSVSAALGMHSQTQIPILYFFKNEEGEQPFKNLELNRALHCVLGYDYLFSETFRLKLETYYQYLYNIPISKYDTPQFSMLNVGDNFYFEGRSDLVNEGEGKNYGVELTLEKFLDRGFYFLFTTSLFNSKYLASDNKWRNTKFNGQYVINLLGGYEFVFNQGSRLLFDIKGVVAGGKWQTPIDKEASIIEDEMELDWENAFSQQAPAYFNLNTRITYSMNGKKTTQEWALDLQNITNHKNVFMETWNNDEKKIETRYQQGLTPMLTYRILF